jgi:hypothetical protein
MVRVQRVINRPRLRPQGQALGPRRGRRRPGSVFTFLGSMALVAALGLGGYYVWLFWGTGISTAHAQHRLGQEISGRIERPHAQGGSVKPPPPAAVADGEPMAILHIPKIQRTRGS